MFKVLTLILAVAIYVVVSVYSFSILVSTLFGLDDFLSLYLYLLAIFTLLFAVTDLLIHYLLKSNKFKLDSEFQLILDNFSYTHKNKKIQLFTSKICPDLICLGFFDTRVLIVNDLLFRDLTPREFRVLVEYELQYSNSLVSKLEQVLKRFYLITYYPLKKVLGFILSEILLSYLLSPFILFYLYTTKICRSAYRFKGKNKEMLEQVAFKLTAGEGEKVLDLYSSFVSYISLSLNKSNLSQGSVSRFSRNEILKW